MEHKRGYRFLLVPDKFKGTVSSQEVASALEILISRYYIGGGEEGRLEIVKLPLADGGEGTIDVVEKALGSDARRIFVDTFDARGRAISAPMLICGDMAFIESAKVCGVASIPWEERNPETATSGGVGVLMRKAAEMGLRRLVIGLGGSATNDGGAPILETCPPDLLKNMEITAVCDVTNPLLGPAGATMTFSRQKGADRDMACRLEGRLEEFAHSHGIDTTAPMGGAAGGIGALLRSLYGAKMVSGWQYCAELVNLEEEIRASDFVVTGEGGFDAQSLGGKLIDGIARLCRSHKRHLSVFCGKNTLPRKVWRSAGISNVYSLTSIFPDMQQRMGRTFELLSGDGVLAAGCDEAGRGALAGPVYAASVILPDDFHHPLLNDSKQMSSRDRDILRQVIEREALAWSVASLGPAEIDRINILNASIAGMHRALDTLCLRETGEPVVPDIILVDGNRFTPYVTPSGRSVHHQCEIHGDARFKAIAAASVLAKTYRDEYMENLAREFPGYKWEQNKGYPTEAHRKAIAELGPTPHHRMSFDLLPQTERLLF